MQFLKRWVILYLYFPQRIFQITLNSCVWIYIHIEAPRSVIKTSTSKGLRLTVASETKMLSLENEANTLKWFFFFFWYSSKTIAFLIHIWLLISKMKPLRFICTQFSILVWKKVAFVEQSTQKCINK